MLNPYLTSISCLECQHEIPIDQFMMTACPNCGSAWLDAQYDYDSVKLLWENGIASREDSLWRYHDLLPIQLSDPEISMGEGWTPLQRLGQYERNYGHTGHIYVKDERAQPTNSFKDRQASISVMAMKQHGITECVLASTGNAAVAYAAYCARAGIKLWLFLTSLTPPEKMREAAIYGCEVIRVSGTYDETKHVAAEFARYRGIHHDKGAKAVPGKESMKTLAYEIAEQLGIKEHPDEHGKWLAPDWYIQSVSGGIGPLGVWKGFGELYHMGLIDKMPKLGIIQAAGCAPMVNSFHRGLEKAENVVPNTLIHVLATGEPGMAYELLRSACLSNGGTMVAVEDGEAFTSMRNIASKGGLSVEPATAVAFAGLEKMLADGTIGNHETVVVNCSGHTFPAESHILGDQYDRYVHELNTTIVAPEQASDGLGAALKNLDEQVTTIVVVDDNPQDRRLVRRLLTSYKQYRVYDARDGKHALEVIADRQPDLVISDLTMPDMDGFELVETLKSNPETAHIPIVVVSAKTLTDHDRMRLSKHAKGIWTKGGLDTRNLVNNVIETLGHQPIGVISNTEELQSSKTSTGESEEFGNTIVVIDDNPLDMRLAQRIIQSGEKHHNIISADNGRDGLKAIYNYHPELIILDLTLPDMDGIDIIDKLQRDEILRDIPVIIYSARDLTPEERKRTENQISTVISKSAVNRQQFLSLIEDQLP